MKKYNFIFFLFSVFLFISCSEDYELKQSVYREDIHNPGLPVYSEWGYNTFGAFWDQKPFISTYYELPAKIIVKSDTLNLQLTGERSGKSIMLRFSFPGYSFEDYQELVNLPVETIDLVKEKCRISFIENHTEMELELINGEFIFKRVQNLYVDTKLEKSIISGYFKFQAKYMNDYITIDKGRFDLGIGYDNFYFIP